MQRGADSPRIDIQLDQLILSILDDAREPQEMPEEIEVERFDPVFGAWLERGVVTAR